MQNLTLEILEARNAHWQRALPKLSRSHGDSVKKLLVLGSCLVNKFQPPSRIINTSRDSFDLVAYSNVRNK